MSNFVFNCVHSGLAGWCFRQLGVGGILTVAEGSPRSGVPPPLRDTCVLARGCADFQCGSRRSDACVSWRRTSRRSPRVMLSRPWRWTRRSWVRLFPPKRAHLWMDATCPPLHLPPSSHRLVGSPSHELFPYNLPAHPPPARASVGACAARADALRRRTPQAWARRRPSCRPTSPAWASTSSRRPCWWTC